MKKAIAGLSLAMLVCSPAMAANWYFIQHGGGPQERGETYIDLSSIELKDGHMRAWIKHEFATDQHFMDEAYPADPRWAYRTSLRYYAFKCLDKEMATTSVTLYEGEMGRSRVVITHSYPPDRWKFQPAIPDTAGFDWLSYACKFRPAQGGKIKSH